MGGMTSIINVKQHNIEVKKLSKLIEKNFPFLFASQHTKCDKILNSKVVEHLHCADEKEFS